MMFPQEQLANLYKEYPILPKLKGKSFNDMKNIIHKNGKRMGIGKDRVDIVTFHMLEQWNRHKVVYNFDETLFETLREQSNKDLLFDIPMDIIKNLPYSTIAVNIPRFNVAVNSGEFKDLSFSFSFDALATIIDGKFIVRYFANEDVSCISKGLMICSTMELNDKMTFQDWIDKIEDRIKKVSDGQYAHLYSLYIQALDRILLQLILYLCSQNADVEVVQAPKRHNNIRCTKTVNVGCHIGHKIRKAYQYVNKGYQGGTKRPHARCGHWHHFWTGCKNAKKLILKWVAPTFIHNGAEIPTLMEVK